MKKLDREIMENAIKTCKLGAKADLLKSLHDNETKSTRSPDAFGWHNIDDIETLEGLEGNYFWAEDPFRPNIIQFQFNPDQFGFRGTYHIFGREEGIFHCTPNNPAIGYAFIALLSEGGGVTRFSVISGMMTDAEWKISIMLLNKAGDHGLIQPPFSAIRMV